MWRQITNNLKVCCAFYLFKVKSLFTAAVIKSIYAAEIIKSLILIYDINFSFRQSGKENIEFIYFFIFKGNQYFLHCAYYFNGLINSSVNAIIFVGKHWSDALCVKSSWRLLKTIIWLEKYSSFCENFHKSIRSCIKNVF